MTGKRIYKLWPLALILVFMGVWSASASLFEAYDAATARSAQLDEAHAAAR